MSNQRVTPLRLFTNILPNTISSDIESVTDGNRSPIEEFSRLSGIPFHERTPMQTARIWHLELIIIKAVDEQEGLAAEIRLYDLDASCGRIAAEAENEVSYGSKSLEIIHQVDAMRKAAGVPSADRWENGPAEYKAALSRWRGLIENAHEAVFLSILERYQFWDALRLFETDRHEFDIRCEIGFLATREPQLDKETINALRRSMTRRYAPVELERIAQRLGEIRSERLTPRTPFGT